MNTENITAIIPIRIDSPERLKNIQTTVSFLLKFYNCQLIIKEVDTVQKLHLPANNRITYIFEQTDNTNYFHRTKILNDMLKIVKTKYTINYDCDILLPQLNMEKSLKLLDEGYDLVYPYEKGTFLTCWDFDDAQINKILSDDDTSWLSYLINKYPVFGNHPGLDIFKKLNLGKIITTGGIQFVLTDSYKKAFGENESFIDWGPEDQERLYRFYILGYKIGWIDSGAVIHMNHPKSIATNEHNFFNKKNHELWNFIIDNCQTKESLFNYLNSQEYTQFFYEN
jgi:hypothetical protein